MAEVYGVKPKKFTKEWWPYFWMYYKWHTIAIVSVVAMIAFTVYQKVTAPKYDLTMTYCGSLVFAEQTVNEITGDLSQFIEDIDGNGEKAIKLQTYSVTGTKGYEEMDAAMLTKLDMEYYNEEAFIFILDEERLKRQLNEVYAEVYDTVDIWADEMPAEDKLYKFGDKAYAVSLSDSTYLNSKGYNCKDMYAILRNCNDEEQRQVYEESKKILNELIK